MLLSVELLRKATGADMTLDFLVKLAGNYANTCDNLASAYVSASALNSSNIDSLLVNDNRLG